MREAGKMIQQDKENYQQMGENERRGLKEDEIPEEGENTEEGKKKG